MSYEGELARHTQALHRRTGRIDAGMAGNGVYGIGFCFQVQRINTTNMHVAWGIWMPPIAARMVERCSHGRRP